MMLQYLTVNQLDIANHVINSSHFSLSNRHSCLIKGATVEPYRATGKHETFPSIDVISHQT